jgi:hypothetical protein
MLAATAIASLACYTEPEPPPTTASANDVTVEMGIGTYCWQTAPNFWGSSSGMCADVFGVVTKAELDVYAGQEISIALPKSAGPLDKVYVTDGPAIDGRHFEDRTVWMQPFDPNDDHYLQAYVRPEEVRIPVELPAGKHVLQVGMWFTQYGDVFYGVVLNVQDALLQ